MTYTYDPWGKLLSVTDGDGNAVSGTHIASVNPLRYRGYYYDTETGFYYLQSRYYDPMTGRFLLVRNGITTLRATGNPEHMTANHASGLSDNYEIILYPGVRYDWGDK